LFDFVSPLFELSSRYFPPSVGTYLLTVIFIIWPFAVILWLHTLFDENCVRFVFSLFPYFYEGHYWALIKAPADSISAAFASNLFSFYRSSVMFLLSLETF